MVCVFSFPFLLPAVCWNSRGWVCSCHIVGPCVEVGEEEEEEASEGGCVVDISANVTLSDRITVVALRLHERWHRVRTAHE